MTPVNMVKHCTQVPMSGISFFCCMRSKAFTRMMLPSDAGRERGQVFPFAGGRSVKSIYSPARMRSRVFWGIDGMP